METISANKPTVVQKLEKPIFVVGCCNSGTTILWRSLLSHPDFSGPTTEGQDLKTLPRCMKHFLGKQTF
ncbi:MAG: sulfotransferase, partial [Deltaproteobacteria bacterium]|nr:sulfotransferase [Deltaproteobacteria bacterium]